MTLLIIWIFHNKKCHQYIQAYVFSYIWCSAEEKEICFRKKMAMLSLLMSVNHIFFSGQQKMQLPSTGTLIIKSLPLYYTNSITPHMHYFSFCKIFPFNIIFTLVSYVVWIYETLAAWSGVNVCCGNWSRVVQGKLARGTQEENSRWPNHRGWWGQEM